MVENQKLLLMEYKIHSINKYNYSINARSGGPDRKQLWGDHAFQSVGILNRKLIFSHPK